VLRLERRDQPARFLGRLGQQGLEEVFLFLRMVQALGKRIDVAQHRVEHREVGPNLRVHGHAGELAQTR
jgi:hypothetical protein